MGASSRGTRCTDESSGRTLPRSASCSDASESHGAPDREASGGLPRLEARRHSASVERWLAVTCEARQRTACHLITTRKSRAIPAAGARRCSSCNDEWRIGGECCKLDRTMSGIGGSNKWDRALLETSGGAENMPLSSLSLAERRLLGRVGSNQRRRDHRARSGGKRRRLCDHAGARVSEPLHLTDQCELALERFGEGTKDGRDCGRRP